jgi:hypothetical protein
VGQRQTTNAPQLRWGRLPFFPILHQPKLRRSGHKATLWQIAGRPCGFERAYLEGQFENRNDGGHARHLLLDDQDEGVVQLLQRGGIPRSERGGKMWEEQELPSNKSRRDWFDKGRTICIYSWQHSAVKLSLLTKGYQISATRPLHRHPHRCKGRVALPEKAQARQISPLAHRSLPRSKPSSFGSGARTAFCVFVLVMK